MYYFLLTRQLAAAYIFKVTIWNAQRTFHSYYHLLYM